MMLWGGAKDTVAATLNGFTSIILTERDAQGEGDQGQHLYTNLAYRISPHSAPSSDLAY